MTAEIRALRPRILSVAVLCFLTKSQTSVQVKFLHPETVRSSFIDVNGNQLHSYDVWSPDKQWLVLPLGSFEPFALASLATSLSSSNLTPLTTPSGL